MKNTRNRTTYGASLSLIRWNPTCVFPLYYSLRTVCTPCRRERGKTGLRGKTRLREKTKFSNYFFYQIVNLKWTGNLDL